MNFFRRIFQKGKVEGASRRVMSAPAPEGWNLTISDLFREMKEGKRRSVGSPEIDWARDYERNLLPAGIRYPQGGDVYEALADTKIKYMTAWKAPFTGSGDAKIKKGERFWIDSEPASEKPISVYAVAIRYAALEWEIIPAQERQAPKYNGYYFSLATADLNQRFRLIETNYRKEK